MQYFGGKSKIAKEIVKVLELYRKSNQLYVEPFVGGANVISKMDGKRHAYDLHIELIEMYKTLQKGWNPPETINEKEYKNVKKNGRDELKAFVGFGCSFSGKYFGGYAKNKRGDNYAKNAKNSLIRKMETMKDVMFERSDYRKLKYKNALIYCDPPYAKTTSFSVGNFNSVEFWQWCRNMSKNNIVIISEYKAPKDFKCIWQKKTKTEIRTKNNSRIDRIEKLFIYINPVRKY